MKITPHQLLNYGIAAVWLVNGIYCKVLNLVPRHQQIVAAILGEQYSGWFTIIIGLAETLMAIWVLSRYRSKLNAISQIIIIATMNTLEFILVPHLLLWGRYNAIFAALLIITIYINEFKLHQVLPANPNVSRT
ncbi:MULTISPECIES: DoxX-like family protein [Pedobacter]|uniref:DoxX-like family protein n=1 Tax=Pedobacter TaxID=84567 RepID=UPI000649E4AB|nr:MULTISPECIES: DoxX-like family protein [Pedobacter]KLT64705.1 hypothetical protein AB669_13195 [Pedobacter sp. BMA]